MFYGSNPHTPPRRSFKDNLYHFITSKAALNRLITINIAIYLAFFVINALFSLTAFLMNSDMAEEWMITFNNLLSCPASFQQLLYQPWSIVTSLFIHADFMHIIMNMLMLYVTGRIFTQYLDNRKLVITYFVGGVAGNLLYMAFYNIFPAFTEVLPFAHALGASGSIMAIMAAITVYRPHHELNLLFIGRIKLYWIMLIFIAIDLLSISKGNAGGHISHLGGMLYGALSQCFYRSYSWNWLRSKKVKRNSGKKKKYTTSQEHSYRPVSDEEFNMRKKEEQEKIDRILDKISSAGYDALTKEEKDFLFNYSKK